ncbi:MAG: hypothetical protein GWP10_20815 [Nitrospiraceae bacterium]|nr:hypothetical protein [Nitrospiraceae bacterium]
MSWQMSIDIIFFTLILFAFYFPVFVPAECRKRKRGYTARQLINGYWPYVLLAAAVYVLMESQFPVQRELHQFVNYLMSNILRAVWLRVSRATVIPR